MKQTADIDPRDTRIAELEARNAELEAENAALRAQLGTQALEIDKLKRHLGIDSTHSSMPPSSDGPKARAERTKKRTRKLGRARGGQPGHPGHKRELLSEERVDHFVEHDPERCDCGLELRSICMYFAYIRLIWRSELFALDLRDIQASCATLLSACRSSSNEHEHSLRCCIADCH